MVENTVPLALLTVYTELVNVNSKYLHTSFTVKSYTPLQLLTPSKVKYHPCFSAWPVLVVQS